MTPPRDRSRLGSRPYGVSDETLAHAARHPRTIQDNDDLAEIEAALAEAEAESRDRGDTKGRLAEWREAVRSLQAVDASSDEAIELRRVTREARRAFHHAERAQRANHDLRTTAPKDAET